MPLQQMTSITPFIYEIFKQFLEILTNLKVVGKTTRGLVHLDIFTFVASELHE